MLTRRTTAVVAAAIAVSAASLTGCGPADKQAAVRAVRRAADVPGVRTGSVSFTIQPAEGAPPAAAAAAVKSTALPATAGVVLDAEHDAAALLAPATMPARLRGRTLTLFDRSLVYSRTADGSVVGARPWFRLDSAHLGALDHYGVKDLARPTNLGDLVVLNPLLAVEQLRGLLTGSVRIDRRATVTAPSTGQQVPAVEYSGNTSLEKVARQLHLDPDRQRPTRNLLGVYAITQDINPVSVWLSPGGELLRVRISFVCKPLKRVRFRAVYDLTLDPPSSSTGPASGALTAPARDEVVDVKTLGQLSLALTDLGRTGASA